MVKHKPCLTHRYLGTGVHAATAAAFVEENEFMTVKSKEILLTVLIKDVAETDK